MPNWPHTASRAIAAHQVDFDKGSWPEVCYLQDLPTAEIEGLHSKKHWSIQLQSLKDLCRIGMGLRRGLGIPSNPRKRQQAPPWWESQGAAAKGSCMPVAKNASLAYFI